MKKDLTDNQLDRITSDKCDNAVNSCVKGIITNIFNDEKLIQSLSENVWTVFADKFCEKTVDH
jgi:hypothetical protein